MRDPFFIEGPASISFSGGRTSGYLLWRVLNAGLQPDVHVTFANTGRERPETLEFVHEVETRWGVPVVWLERSGELYEGEGWHPPMALSLRPFVTVDFETASRDGEPFANLLTHRGYLPTPAMRFCTEELKIRPMSKWMRAQGYEHWANAVGIRYDEPSRVARMRSNNSRERWDVILPLADARVTLADVEAFWSAQPFDLRLNPWEGNCDLCFLKARVKRDRILRERPDLAAWWIEQERRIGQTFRKDQPSYAAMLEASTGGQPLLPGVEDDLVPCMCTD